MDLDADIADHNKTVIRDLGLHVTDIPGRDHIFSTVICFERKRSFFVIRPRHDSLKQVIIRKPLIVLRRCSTGFRRLTLRHPCSG